MKITSVWQPKSSLHSIALVIEPSLNPQIFEEFHALRDKTPALKCYRFEFVEGMLVVHSVRTDQPIEFSNESVESVRHALACAEQTKILKDAEANRRIAMELETIRKAAKAFGIPVENERPERKIDLDDTL
jgi:hypothetical protein